MVIRVSLTVYTLEVLQSDPKLFVPDPLAELEALSQSHVFHVILVRVVPLREEVVVLSHVQGAWTGTLQHVQIMCTQHVQIICTQHVQIIFRIICRAIKSKI